MQSELLIEEFFLRQEQDSYKRIKGKQVDFSSIFIEDEVDAIRSVGRNTINLMKVRSKDITILPCEDFGKDFFILRFLHPKHNVRFCCEVISPEKAKVLILEPKYQSKLIEKFDKRFYCCVNSLYPFWIMRFDDKLWKISVLDYSPDVFIFLEKLVELMQKLDSENACIKL